VYGVTSDLLLMAEEMLDVSFRISRRVYFRNNDGCVSIHRVHKCMCYHASFVCSCVHMCACVFNTDDAGVNTKLITFLAHEYASVII